MADLELVSQSSDGRLRRYRYRAYEFEVEQQGWFMWWCFQGIRVPRDPLEDDDLGILGLWEWYCIDRSDGWGSFTLKALLRKLCRSVDKHIRDDQRRQQVELPA